MKKVVNVQNNSYYFEVVNKCGIKNFHIISKHRSGANFQTSLAITHFTQLLLVFLFYLLLINQFYNQNLATIYGKV